MQREAVIFLFLYGKGTDRGFPLSWGWVEGVYSLRGSYLVEPAREGHDIWSRAVLLLLVPATTRQLL